MNKTEILIKITENKQHMSAIDSYIKEENEEDNYAFVLDLMIEWHQLKKENIRLREMYVEYGAVTEVK